MALSEVIARLEDALDACERVEAEELLASLTAIGGADVVAYLRHALDVLHTRPERREHTYLDPWGRALLAVEGKAALPLLFERHDDFLMLERDLAPHLDEDVLRAALTSDVPARVAGAARALAARTRDEQASAAFVAARSACAPLVVEALSSPLPDVRRAAAAAVASMASSLAPPLAARARDLLLAFRDDDLLVAPAVPVLGDDGDTSDPFDDGAARSDAAAALPALAALLRRPDHGDGADDRRERDPHDDDDDHAHGWLVRFASRTTAPARRRAEAIDALARLTPAVSPLLATALFDDAAVVRRAVVDAVARFGDLALAACRDVLFDLARRDASDDVRSAARALVGTPAAAPIDGAPDLVEGYAQSSDLDERVIGDPVLLHLTSSTSAADDDAPPRRREHLATIVHGFDERRVGVCFDDDDTRAPSVAVLTRAGTERRHAWIVTAAAQRGRPGSFDPASQALDSELAVVARAAQAWRAAQAVPWSAPSFSRVDVDAMLRDRAFWAAFALAHGLLPGWFAINPTRAALRALEAQRLAFFDASDHDAIHAWSERLLRYRASSSMHGRPLPPLTDDEIAERDRLLRGKRDSYGVTAAIVRRRLNAGDVEVRIGLGAGYTWSVVFGVESIGHRLDHAFARAQARATATPRRSPPASADEPLWLGHDDAHSALPILRLAELELLVSRVSRVSPVSRDASSIDARIDPGAARILLSATTNVTRHDDAALVEASGTALERALVDVGGMRADTAAFIARRFAKPPPRGRWWCDDAHGWVTSFRYAKRNVRDVEERPGDFARLRAFFTAMEPVNAPVTSASPA